MSPSSDRPGRHRRPKPTTRPATPDDVETPPDDVETPFGLGAVPALVAGLAWALTTVTIRSSRLIRLAPEKLLFYQLGVSMLVTPLLSLLLGESWNWSFSAFAVASLLLQTVVVAFASYLLWM